ncbi:MAG TPA: Flp family type IVb pilin [Acidimicrobiia bacterium]|nr:Flp family type IVb pilin [Acidimicrobiia bacterium]
MFCKIIYLYTKHERGASMVEYALLVMMIAMVALIAVAVAGTELSETYSEISSGLTEAGN